MDSASDKAPITRSAKITSISANYYMGSKPIHRKQTFTPPISIEEDDVVYATFKAGEPGVRVVRYEDALYFPTRLEGEWEIFR